MENQSTPTESGPNCVGTNPPQWCSEQVKLTPQVTLNNSVVYVIRADTNDTRKGRDTGEVCVVFEEEVADRVLESLAKEEVKNLSSDPNIRVFMEIHTQNVQPYLNKKIDICTQSLGYIMNGSIQKIMTFGYTRVAYASFEDLLATQETTPLEEKAEEQRDEGEPDLKEEPTGSDQVISDEPDVEHSGTDDSQQ